MDFISFLKRTTGFLERADKRERVLLLLSSLLALLFIHFFIIPRDYNGQHVQLLTKQDKVFKQLVKDINKSKGRYNGQGGFSPDPRLKVVFYRLRKGDNFWEISKRTGLSMDSLLSMNHLKNVHILSTNQEVRIPNKEGVLYRTRPGETLESIAEKFRTGRDDLIDVNELSEQSIKEGMDIFIPNGKLDFEQRQNILGIFILPSLGRITSGFSWRKDPLSRTREFHTGLDIANVTGTKVLAAQSGRVIYAGVYKGYGNLIILQHSNGYSTRYGHLFRFYVSYGAKVRQGQVIGAIGSTGRVTGSHLHFEIRQYGQPRNPYFLMRFSQK